MEVMQWGFFQSYLISPIDMNLGTGNKIKKIHLCIFLCKMSIYEYSFGHLSHNSGEHIVNKQNCVQRIK